MYLLRQHSWFALVSCLIIGASALGTCEFSNTPYPAECTVRCSNYGVNGDLQDPGVAAATYLSDMFILHGATCTDKWMLEILNSRFPSDVLLATWLTPADPTDPLPPVTDVLLHTCGLRSIQAGAFSTSISLGINVKKLSIYYNNLAEITNDMTLGLGHLETFEWVGNGMLSRAESKAVMPFRTTLLVLQITDCGFESADVVSNITGYCNTAGDLPNLRSIELSFNPGPGLATIGKNHFTQLSGVFSMYMWNSGIEFLENTEVFDPVAKTIQTIDLSNNNLRTMPNGCLDSIIAENKPRISLALRGNPWACDCHLQWLQNVIKFSIGGVTLSDNPTCASPASEAGKLLIEADMTECPTPIVVPPVEISC